MRAHDLNYGCLPVSIRALGGNVAYYNIINKEVEMRRLFTLEKFDLEIGGFVEIDEQVDADEVQSTLEWLFEERAQFEGRDLAGIIVYRFDSNKESEDEKPLTNHYFTIFPREKLSEKVRKKLEKENRYLIVDTSSEAKPIGRTSPEELADYMNQVVESGGKFLLIQVFKK